MHLFTVSASNLSWGYWGYSCVPFFKSTSVSAGHDHHNVMSYLEALISDQLALIVHWALGGPVRQEVLEATVFTVMSSLLFLCLTSRFLLPCCFPALEWRGRQSEYPVSMLAAPPSLMTLSFVYSLWTVFLCSLLVLPGDRPWIHFVSYMLDFQDLTDFVTAFCP